MTRSIRAMLLEEKPNLYPLTVHEYHKMIELGVLPEGEPYELLDGMIVRKERNALGEDPMTVGRGHAWAIRALTRLNADLSPRGCFMQIQLPITLPLLHEPEPDAAIIIGTEEQYAEKHPFARDVLCVIEVADSSLNRDRNIKLPIYAEAEIEPYILLNLQQDRAEVYRQPNRHERTYAPPELLGLEQALSLPVAQGEALVVPVKMFFPPPR
jgi:Uma2 family endonuclease